MHIVCPHCTTSYAVNPATFGTSGRTVRCARCKETWRAQPENLARAEALAPAMAAEPSEKEDLSAWGLSSDAVDDNAHDDRGENTPLVESPSISSSMPAYPPEDASWTALSQDDVQAASPASAPKRGSRLGRLKMRPRKFGVSLGSACAGMAALVMALIFWRGDVVRLLPQTAAFYKMVGLNVNLRNLSFKDVKVSSETVDGKPVLVIEGVIVGEGRKQQIELPRLRFIVRDEKGTEIYAWNALLDQTAIKPGESAWFRSRLASPPADARSIDVRFYNKHDIGARGA